MTPKTIEGGLLDLEADYEAANAAYNREHWSFGRSSSLTPTMASMQRLWDASGKKADAWRAMMDFKRALRDGASAPDISPD